MYVLEDYDNNLEKILKKGVWRTNKRTGKRTLSILGMQARYNLTERFPVLTRRKVFPKSVFAELLWFLSGSTNNNDLKNLGANFWTPWQDEKFEKDHGYTTGSFGPTYGFLLRHFGGFYGNGIGGEAFTTDAGNRYGEGGFDQLSYMMDRIKHDSSCRRILFSLWDPKLLNKQRLPPCHYTFQIFIDDEGRMSGMLTQRSADYPIGVPANIQFYSALVCMIAQQTNYQPHELIHSTGDSHCYEDQLEAMEGYLSTPILPSPTLELKKAENIFSYKLSDFVLKDYESGPNIKIPVAV